MAVAAGRGDTRRRRRAGCERVLGHLLLLSLLAGAVLLAARQDVRTATARVAGELLSGVRGATDEDPRFEVATLEGVRIGAPVHCPTADGATPVVGHVIAVEPGAPPAVRVRWAVGGAPSGTFTLDVHPPRRSLRDAVALAVPDAEARAFANDFAARALALWESEVRPGVEARLPAFLERIDPTRDTRARELATRVGETLVARLEPLADELAAHVTKAVEDKFDLLDRLGLLWKMVRGDGQGLRRELVPVAKRATAAWWERHRDRVLATVGGALAERSGEIRAWAEGELLQATLDELVTPLWAAQRPRLEAEAEALLRTAAARFVESPVGGFRVRFASAVRHILLGKRTALLLLVPAQDTP